MRSRYTARESALGDHEGPVLSLWAQNLEGMDEAGARAKLRHGYLANPAGPGACLLLHDEASGQPVGVQCLHARTYWRGENPQRAGALADYAVASAHRSLGPALTLMRTGLALGQSRFDFVYGFPNQKSQPVCHRAGMQRIGGTRRYGRLLRSRFLLRPRLPAAVLPWAARAADLLVTLLDGLHLLRHGLGLAWREVQPDDARLDDLWRRRPAGLLLCERSTATLQWRYGGADTLDWRLAIAEDGRGRSFGYVAWACRNDLVLIGDFFCTDPDRGTRRLLTSFAWWARRLPASAVSLEFFGRAEVEKQLRGAGFIAKSGASPLYVAPGRQPAPADGQHLYVTGFDRDGD